MGRLIEEQAVIDCLTNTAKYYEREDADEWTKGIHYGLLHGVDNILDSVKPIEAIPKADYENRLKVDMVAVFEELKAEIEELYPEHQCTGELTGFADAIETITPIIQQKINALKKEAEDGKAD